MSYNTPMLLLVGAAQNLVREASPLTSKDASATGPTCHVVFEDNLAAGDEYQEDGGW